ncbi:MAG: EVE domain-containing protein [Spirochaetes bacterium]|nr:EVE domain-containing protein [Spirochaetota bacterium]
MKTEPDVFSIDDLEARGREPWSGVRNYQARNFMRDAMAEGDGVLLYHSNCPEPGVAGLARVAGKAYPDPTQFDPKNEYFDPKSPRENPRWVLVDVAFEKRFAAVLPLSWMKGRPELAHLACLQRGNRLSITPVDPTSWSFLLAEARRIERR